MRNAGLKRVYFIGIGGIGMSALARYFHSEGMEVAGYDKTPSALTGELVAEGMTIHFEDDVKSIPAAFRDSRAEELMVVFTPAVPPEHSELKYFTEKGYRVMKRSAVLGFVASGKRTVAVAGTHGKTTTSTLIAHMLRSSGIDCSAFLGGISVNYNTNILQGSSDILVAEADEYDRSFLALHPYAAVITSLDPDHLDIYGDGESMEGSYSQFSSQISKEGCLITRPPLVPKLRFSCRLLGYSLSDPTPYHAENIRIENGRFHYDIVAGSERIGNVSLGAPGRHNVENSVAAAAAAMFMGAPAEGIREGIRTFLGVKRRFEYHIRREDLVFIDDYAHHPAELKATISAARELYPGKMITGIFQPHLYTRTRDFADEFAASLDLLDEAILLDIYPAREQPIPGVSSGMLLEKMKLQKKNLVGADALASHMRSKRSGVILMMGAGDIELQVEPVKKALLN